MLKAIFKKKWIYGSPDAVKKLRNEDWLRWLRFVNIAADDHSPGTSIFTEWDETQTLYGYSQAIINENEEPVLDNSGSPVNMVGLNEALKNAEAEDWRIETHPELFKIAMHVMAWIEKIEEKQRNRASIIREVLKT